MVILTKQRILSEGACVFESTSNPGLPITGDAITWALERVRIKHGAELERFSPHDLRRSVATGCAEYLDAPERLIELLLNHVPRDRLIRTYQVGQRAEKLSNVSNRMTGKCDLFYCFDFELLAIQAFHWTTS